MLIVMRSLRLIGQLACLLLLCSGCPEAPNRYRQVSLTFPAPEGSATVSLTVTSTEVRQALSVIDEALRSKGFVKVGSPLEAPNPEFICAYSQDSAGPARLGEPWVYLRGGKLEIIFAEGRGNSPAYDTSARATARFLAEVLRNHYGKDRVLLKHVRV
jgi:hypothetical protein